MRNPELLFAIALIALAFVATKKFGEYLVSSKEGKASACGCNG